MSDRTRWKAEQHRFQRRLAINQQGEEAVIDWSESRAELRAFIQVNNPGFPIPPFSTSAEEGIKLEKGKWPGFMVAYLYDPCKGTNACFKLFCFLYRNGMVAAKAREVIEWWWDTHPEMCNTSREVASQLWEVAFAPVNLQYVLFQPRIWDMWWGACSCFAANRAAFAEFCWELVEDINSVQVREALLGERRWKTPRPFRVPEVADPGNPPYYLPIVPQNEEEAEEMGAAFQQQEENPVQEDAPIFDDAPVFNDIAAEEELPTQPLPSDDEEESEVEGDEHPVAEQAHHLSQAIARIDALERSKRTVKRNIQEVNAKRTREDAKSRPNKDLQKVLQKTADGHKRRLLELQALEEPLLRRYYQYVGRVKKRGADAAAAAGADHDVVRWNKKWRVSWEDDPDEEM